MTMVVASPTHFMYDFWRKTFLMLQSIERPNLIVCFPFLLEILNNICIEIVSQPACYVIILKLTLAFLSSHFPTWSKELGQKFKYLKVGFTPSEKVCVICFIKGPLKMMKNAFNFILKALFVLKMFNFLLWLFGHVEKTAWLER